ncbi:unnamed protein product [Amoebophrya sp. A25]|nr:unnamed protein product [Amoebophrya sp. A25]|eukprot:GSA25T00007123001.1
MTSASATHASSWSSSSCSRTGRTSGGTSFSNYSEKLSHDTTQRLKKHGFWPPTEIQKRALQPVLQGRDVLARAAPGSGKTVAFLAPVLERAAQVYSRQHEPILWLTPTAELAEQTRFVAGQVKAVNQRVLLLQPGMNQAFLRRILREGHDMLIGTPGVLLRLASSSSSSSATKILSLHPRIVVLDEADQLFSKQYVDQTRELLRLVSSTREQTLAFSATKPAWLRDLMLEWCTSSSCTAIKQRRAATTPASSHITSSKCSTDGDIYSDDHAISPSTTSRRLSFSPTGGAPHGPVAGAPLEIETGCALNAKISHLQYALPPCMGGAGGGSKMKNVPQKIGTAVGHVLSQWRDGKLGRDHQQVLGSRSSPNKLALVFAPTRSDCTLIMEYLKRHLSSGCSSSREQLQVQQLSGAKSVTERMDTVKSFRKGEFGVLVTTDVAARGLDLPEISLVIHTPSGIQTATSAGSPYGTGPLTFGSEFPSSGRMAVKSNNKRVQNSIPTLDTYVHRAGRIRIAGTSVVMLPENTRKETWKTGGINSDKNSMIRGNFTRDKDVEEDVFADDVVSREASSCISGCGKVFSPTSTAKMKRSSNATIVGKRKNRLRRVQRQKSGLARARAAANASKHSSSKRDFHQIASNGGLSSLASHSHVLLSSPKPKRIQSLERQLGIRFADLETPDPQELREERLKTLLEECERAYGLDTESFAKDVEHYLQHYDGAQLLAQALCLLEQKDKSFQWASPLSGKKEYVPVLFPNYARSAVEVSNGNGVLNRMKTAKTPNEAANERTVVRSRPHLLSVIQKALEGTSGAADGQRENTRDNDPDFFVADTTRAGSSLSRTPSGINREQRAWASHFINRRLGRVALTTKGYVVDVKVDDLRYIVENPILKKMLRPVCVSSVPPIVKNEQRYQVSQFWKRKGMGMRTMLGNAKG